MPKFKVIVDVDSAREEAEHIESHFDKGIEASDEHDADMKVSSWIKKQLYGGPYYAIEEMEDDKLPPEKENKPEAGKLYALTGGPGSKCIANGNTWEESMVGEEVKP
tara:strand:- start:211 stop:531 length:321 start_codon:yes stop_codon:yes gene_type:complete